VVDDYNLRQFLSHACKTRLGIRLLGSIGRVEAVQKAEELRPDLILLDIGLPKLKELKSLGDT